MDTQSEFEKMAEAILDDDEGITERGYRALLSFGYDLGLNMSPIIDAVDATDGRWYWKPTRRKSSRN